MAFHHKTYRAGEAISEGDLVYISADGTVFKSENTQADFEVRTFAEHRVEISEAIRWLGICSEAKSMLSHAIADSVVLHFLKAEGYADVAEAYHSAVSDKND